MISDKTSGAGRARLLAEARLTRKLGRLGDYPQAIVEQAQQTYEIFIGSYIDILRLKDPLHPADPAGTFQIDMAVVDEMRHFFSDYQHIAREFIRMEHLLSQLAQTDRQSQPQRYQQILDEIKSPGQKDEWLTKVMA